MSELIQALNQLEAEKHIDKEIIMEAIETSLKAACQKDFGKSADVEVNMDRETGDMAVYLKKTIVEEVENPVTEVSMEEARTLSPHYEIGDTVFFEVTPKNFGRIAAQQARGVIVQKIKEEENRSLYEHFEEMQQDVVTGVVQRITGRNIYVSLDDKTDAVLTEKEQVKGEVFHPMDRIKLYVVEVKKTKREPRIIVSRTHRGLVKRLFEREVAEIYQGVVEIRAIAREPGSRTKIAVWSNDPNVDPVGACVGKNGDRVNAVVNDLQGEKIDIIAWDEDPAILIRNALSPSEVLSVTISSDGKSARVVVPDYQLSLAIGKEGQNARLAAKLTGFKIDIKSESQAAELEEELAFEDDFDEEFDEDYDEAFDEGYDETAEADGEDSEETAEEEADGGSPEETAEEEAGREDSDEAAEEEADGESPEETAEEESDSEGSDETVEEESDGGDDDEPEQDSDEEQTGR